MPDEIKYLYGKIKIAANFLPGHDGCNPDFDVFHFPAIFGAARGRCDFCRDFSTNAPPRRKSPASFAICGGSDQCGGCGAHSPDSFDLVWASDLPGGAATFSLSQRGRGWISSR